MPSAALCYPPHAVVCVLPEADFCATPASVVVTPPTLTFHPNDWTPDQVLLATVTVTDDDVDSAQDVEDFTLTYSVSTTDAVYASKAGNLTVVVRVQDDDTAGIVLENPDAILPLTEGEAAGAKLTVTGLSSAPLQDVTLRLTTSLPSLVTVEPSSILIRKGDWASVSREVTVRALRGQYGGVTSASVVLAPESEDPKYNAVAARTTKAVAITVTTRSAGQIVLTSSDTGATLAETSVVESGSFTYKVSLDTVLTDSSESVVVSIASSSSECSPAPASLTFSASSFSTAQSVTVAASKDHTDQGDSGVFATCVLVHSVTSSDTAYSTASTLNASLAVTINDDDAADMKLRPTTTEMMSGNRSKVKIEDYQLKFLGPLTLAEGASDRFGLQLDTRPTADVVVLLQALLELRRDAVVGFVVPASCNSDFTSWLGLAVLKRLAASSKSITTTHPEETLTTFKQFSKEIHHMFLSFSLFIFINVELS